jgi:hypothetical protein
LVMYAGLGTVHKGVAGPLDPVWSKNQATREA